ncbi:MAG TPA: CCA tRNA nucleotidyltransferase [Pararhizobium sp.]|nr:CCA tRNA nucleotidyltransferase [Pararhizobium sp.]
MTLLNRDEGEARIVGGAVRNALLGMPVSDIDIATTLVPEAVMTRAGDAGIKMVPTGVEHGTVTLVLAGKAYEVTTLRADVETDGRHAKVAFGKDWQVDAERRDLTINALYARGNGEIVDLVGGLSDMEEGIVRFIGDPAERIAEDYLRVLRFFRFFAWYGSGRPDGEGLKACARAKDHLDQLSVERVWMEMKKLFSAPDPGRALLWMRQTGVLTAVLPESEKWGIDTLPALVRTERAFGWEPDAMLRLAAIVPPDTERVAALAARLRLSRAEAGRLDAWTEAPTVAYDIKDAAFDRLLYRSEPEAVTDRLKLQLANARARAISDSKALVEAAGFSRLVERAEAWQKPVFPLTGKDMIANGIEEGPAVGEAMRRLETEWVESNFKLDRDTLLARLAGKG